MMKAWRNLSIKIRLIILFLMAAIIPSFILASIVGVQSLHALSNRIRGELSSVRDVKKNELTSNFHAIAKNLDGLTRMGNLREIFANYNRAFKRGNGARNGVYRALTGRFKNKVAAIVKQLALDDLMFINEGGDIIASHAGRTDLGMNLKKVPLRETHLSKGFRQAVSTKKVVITDMAFYKPAGNAPRLFILIPIINGKSPTFNYAPSQFMGIMAASITPERVTEWLFQGVHLSRTEEIFLVGPDGLMRSNSRLDKMNRSVFASLSHPEKGKVNTPFVRAALDGKTGVAKTVNYLGLEVLSAFTPVSIVTGKPWALVTEISLQEAFQPIYSIRKTTFEAGILLYIIAIFLALISAFSITRPVNRILKDLKAIADGDLTRKIAVRGKDEIGQMAQALQGMLNGVIGEGQSFKEGLSFPFFITDSDLKITYANAHFAAMVGKSREEIVGQSCSALVHARQCDTDDCHIKRALKSGEAVRDIAEMEKDGQTQWFEVGAGALKDLKGNISGAYEILIDITEQKKAEKAIEENQRMLVEVAKEVQEVANQVATAAEILSSQSDEIAAGAEEQSAQANQVAAAVEEMNATIAEVAKNAQEAADRSREAQNEASQGSRVVEDSVHKIEALADITRAVAESVEALAERSREIDKVIDVISDIADQTNLLALNATIEAASAGDAGKGFAVVAGEVKELAKQTAESTESVGEAIEQIQEGIKGAVEMIEETLQEVQGTTALAKEAGNALNKILERVNHTAEMVTEIAAAAQQQATAVEEINKNVDGIMTVSQETAKGVTEYAKAALELERLANRLKDAVNRFNLAE